MGVIIAVYSVAAYSRPQLSYLALALSPVGIALAWLSSLEQLPGEIGNLISDLLLFLIAWFLGHVDSRRRTQAAKLEEQAMRLESEREDEARLAGAAERGRIARELHDVVAHNMSVMVVQAGALRRVHESDPVKIEQSLLSIEQTGRQGLTEMRRLLGVLRKDDDQAATPLGPQPSLSRIDELVDQVRRTGLPVELRIQGTPRPLPPGVDLSAYRIVREALTNTLRHAGQAKAQIVLAYHQQAVEIEVCDDGAGSSGQHTPGHGLVGMHERVMLFGGNFQAGPRPEGGYRVWARLPVETAG